jgi:hypothetical protein
MVAWAPLAAAGIGAAGSMISSWLSKPEKPKREKRAPPQFTPKETKIQKKKRKLIDDLLYSLKTPDGTFSELYEPSEEVFQKYYVDPAKQRFQNQIAPAIQQKYIATGQHRGSGLEGALARAGVDMDELLNQQYMAYQQDTLNRRQNAMSQILGAESGPMPQNIQQPQQNYSSSNAVKQGLSGYLGSDSFSKSVEDILSSFKKDQTDTRRGFQS